MYLLDERKMKGLFGIFRLFSVISHIYLFWDLALFYPQNLRLKMCAWLFYPSRLATASWIIDVCSYRLQCPCSPSSVSFCFRAYSTERSTKLGNQFHFTLRIWKYIWKVYHLSTVLPQQYYVFRKYYLWHNWIFWGTKTPFVGRRIKMANKDGLRQNLARNNVL